MITSYKSIFKESSDFSEPEKDFVKKLKAKIIKELETLSEEDGSFKKILTNIEQIYPKLLKDMISDRNLDRLIEANIERLL